MKLILSLITSLFCLPLLAAESQLSLYTDKQTYAPSDSAMLLARIKINPINSNYEVILKSQLNTNDLKVISVNSTHGFSAIQSLSLGNYTWRVSAYIQDQKIASRYEKAIFYYKKMNLDLSSKLAMESDPNIRESLSKIISRNERIISQTQALVLDNQKLISTAEKTFVVTPNKNNSYLAPLVWLDTNRLNRTYNVSEQAVFSAEMLSPIIDNEGPHEVILSGRVESTPTSINPQVIPKRTSDMSFSFTTRELVANDIGERKFLLKILSRPKKQSDFIRQAIRTLKEKELELDRSAQASVDGIDRSYYHFLKFEVSDFSIMLAEHLQNILSQVGEETALVFRVNP